jgi:dihydrofolate synthase/folylpolyglutamate synthase
MVTSTPRQPFGQTVRIAFGANRYRHPLTVPGRQMAQNAALAAACAQVSGLLERSDPIAAVEAGLASTRLPGRLELLRERPWVVIDAAHTPSSTRALAEVARQLPASATHLLISLSGNRDPEPVLAPLIGSALRVTLTLADPSRSLSPERIKPVVARLRPDLPIEVIPNPVAATLRARQALAPSDLLCVFGSVYLAGIARSTLIRND